MRLRAYLCAIVGLCWSACGSGESNNDGGGPAKGTERGRCYGNGTCNAGLTCASNYCVRFLFEAGMSNDGGAGEPDLNLNQHGLTTRVDNSTCLLGVTGAPPAKLSDTGCFSDTVHGKPAAALVPYDVNSPLWSDGIVKHRYMVIPPKTTIGFTADGAWQMPEGTILIKDFRVNNIGIETRILIRRGTRWDGYSYKWDDAGTEAHLLEGGDTRKITLSYNGSPREITHTFPSRTQCLVCHTAAAGGVLGLQTAQMNRRFQYANQVIDNQLRAMAHIGLFDQALPAALDKLSKLPDPADATQPLSARARSYLHSNCAQCHRPQGVATSFGDLRYATPLAQTGLCNRPAFNNLGLYHALVLKPGASSESIVWLRMARRGAGQMPPLASQLVDPIGATVVRDWIDQLGDSECGSAPSPDAGPVGDAGAAPTFAVVYDQVLKTCKHCHGSLTEGGLNMGSAEVAYANLVGVTSVSATCGGATLVEPGYPETSLLWRKIAPGVGICGDKMPNGTAGVAPDKAELVHKWIKAGAPK